MKKKQKKDQTLNLTENCQIIVEEESKTTGSEAPVVEEPVEAPSTEGEEKIKETEYQKETHSLGEQIKEMLIRAGYEQTLLFDNGLFSPAFTGIDNNGRAVYDYDRMVVFSKNYYGINDEDAVLDVEQVIDALKEIENGPIILYGVQSLLEVTTDES